MPVVEPSAGFAKALKKLKDQRRQKAALDAVKRFIEDPSHPGLNFERIRGTEDCWSIRSNRGDRVILQRRIGPKDENQAVDERHPETFVEVYLLLEVGSHDVYRRY